jgi:hypothetical protein
MTFNAEEEERINALVGALISATPERFTTIDCTVEQVESQCSGRFAYRICCEACPDEVISEPTEDLHKAAYETIKLLNAEAITINMHQKDGGWSFSLKTAYLNADDIDAERERHNEAIWERVFDERGAFFEKCFGTIPEDINKVMTVHWVGGGLLDFPESNINGHRVLVTSGLSNPDQPSGVFVTDFDRQEEADGNISFSTRLGSKTPRFVPPDWSGLGYEMSVILNEPQDERSIAVLSWLVQAELNRDGDFFGMINRYGGVTVQDMELFDNTFADFLFYPAMEPIPSAVQLSSGTMHLIIATRITRRERDFAKENSCGYLIERLIEKGVGQVTDYKRISIL